MKKSKCDRQNACKRTGRPFGQSVGLPVMAKFLQLFLCVCLIFGSGCASLSDRRGSASSTGDQEESIQFAGTAYVCVLGQEDHQVQFVERQVSLTERAFQLGGEHLKLSEIDSAALYPGDVTHPNQLQLLIGRRLIVIQVLGSLSSNDDQRTLQLYEQLSGLGVPRGRTEQFYYVGMNLEDVKRTDGGDGFFAAAAGARVGGFIWDSIKGLGSLLVKPLLPLF